MKKAFILFSTIALILFGLSNSASALNYSGTYMFTMNGNDSENSTPTWDTIEIEINDWFTEKDIYHDSVELDLYDKVEANDATSSFMTVSYYDGNKTGEWTTATPIEFYSVKGGNEFAFYWLGYAGADSGYWSTEHLTNGGSNVPEISHLSTWNTVDGGTTPPIEPVPEPGTIVLLGAGLFGMGCFIRRKNN